MSQLFVKQIRQVALCSYYLWNRHARLRCVPIICGTDMPDGAVFLSFVKLTLQVALCHYALFKFCFCQNLNSDNAFCQNGSLTLRSCEIKADDCD